MAKRFIGGGDADVAPAGSVQAFAGAEAPYGWLLCDGSVLNTSDYPKLSAALNGAWDSFAHPVDGTPTVGAGQFALPNMKGLYLAGAGNSGGDARSVGVFQADENKSHSHSLQIDVDDTAQISGYSGTTGVKPLYGSTTNTTGARDRVIINGLIGSSSVYVKNRVINASAGGAETRPVTAPVNYIIKY